MINIPTYLCILVLKIFFSYIDSNKICHYRQYPYDAKLLVDTSWIKYVKEVYAIKKYTLDNNHSLTSSINFMKDIFNKNNYKFYYLYSQVKILSFIASDKPKGLGLLNAPKLNGRWLYRESSRAVMNNEWVEVMRQNIIYLFDGLLFSSEGYSNLSFDNSSHRSNFVPYGCWFVYSPGSGIYINVKKVWIIEIKGSMLNNNFFGPKGCIKGDHSTTCGDKYYCTYALSKGYDSIHFLDWNELGFIHIIFALCRIIYI